MLKSEVINQIPQPNNLITTYLGHPQGTGGISRCKLVMRGLKKVTGKKGWVSFARAKL
jgi:hypothetical protein